MGVANREKETGGGGGGGGGRENGSSREIVQERNMGEERGREIVRIDNINVIV